MLNWNRIDDPKTYRTERYDLLVLLEGVTTGPYVDSAGDPTIGIGFNLVYNLAPVLEAMVGKAHWDDRLYDRLAAEIGRDYTSGQNTLLASRLDAVMADWHNNHDAKVSSHFDFATSAQINRALTLMAPTYDGYIDRWIADIPDSAERAALFSMTWNAPSLLGPKLKAAIEVGDRAEAWYEIRYNSNGIQLAGIANRRYVEAETFGLYDREGHAGFGEALEVGQMYATHRSYILDYEDRYDPVAAGQIKGVSSISAIGTAMGPAIDAVLKHFGLPSRLDVEELQVAGPNRPDLAGDGTSFDGKSRDADLMVGDRNANHLSGGAGRDIFIGRGGADTLSGGSGADLFVFTGTPDGRDRITDFAHGADRIDLSELGALTFLQDKGSAFSGSGDEIRWFTSRSDTIIEVDTLAGGGAELTIRLSGHLTIGYQDFLL